MKRFLANPRLLSMWGVVGFVVICASYMCLSNKPTEAASSAELAAPRVRIVYSRLTGKWTPGKDSSGRYDLFLLSPGASVEPKQLTNRSDGFGSVVWYPQFSPDGKSILFVADKTGSKAEIDQLESPTYRMQGTDLWRLAVSSGEARPLTTDGSGYRLFSWAPNADWVVAIQYGWPPYDQINVWDLKSSKRRLLSKRPKQEELTDLFWSRDSAKLYFQRDTSTGDDPNLYVIPRGGGKAVVRVKGNGERHNYSFSQDGQKLAFVQDKVVYTSDADGSSMLQVMRIAESASASRPSWSAKGQLAVSETNQETKGQAYTTKLYLYDTPWKRPFTAISVPYNVTDARWSTNGLWLFLKVTQTGSTDAPDPKTGWYVYHREGLLAVSIKDRQILLLKEPNEETKGLDWIEASE